MVQSPRQLNGLLMGPCKFTSKYNYLDLTMPASLVFPLAELGTVEMKSSKVVVLPQQEK